MYPGYSSHNGEQHYHNPINKRSQICLGRKPLGGINQLVELNNDVMASTATLMPAAQ